MKTVKWTILPSQERLLLKINEEDVYFIFINNEEVWNTLSKKEAEYYFDEFKTNQLI